MFRSPSTPSLKRIWICHTCGLENNSVTWHCLNCECVSYLAPIYKETLKKKTSFDCDTRDKNSSDVSYSTSSSGKYGLLASDTPKLRSMDSEILDKTTTITAINKLQPMPYGQTTKCHLCLYKTKPSAQHLLAGNGNASKEPQICRHQARTKYLRFPLIGQAAKIGPEQKSFDDSKYYVQNGLYYSNRKINKSLSSITDSFSGGGGIENNGSIFGERIVIGKNRPNTLLVNEEMNNRRTTSKGTTESYTRQLSVPNPQQGQFNDFIASHIVEHHQPVTNTTTIKRSILCDVCGVCNQNRCSRSISSSSNETPSRFTITTLSRAASSNQTLKNHQTLPRNGGVFVAVRDWCTDAHSQQIPVRSGESRTNSIQDGYYEILKNPNNPPYENQEIISKEQETTNNAHTYENQQQVQEPIYAVVNKQNKTKNKLQSQQSEPKFTYIGMNASKSSATGISLVQPSKPLSEPDSLYASIAPLNSKKLPTDSNNTSHITITSSVDHPGSDTSEIYAKVWKGPRKSLDSQKMYAQFYYYSFLFCFF